MADIPYMLGVKNLSAILARIKEAGTPPKFTGEFLKNNLGFASSSDRGVIPVLKALGFLTPDGLPTPRYNEFRDDTRSGVAMADGLRDGWADLFLSDQRAYEKGSTQLKELFKNVTGKGEAVAEKMATTFKALASTADWTAASLAARGEASASADVMNSPPLATGIGAPDHGVRDRMALHHDIHIHLPPTSDVSVYAAIFRALRSELLD